MLQLYTGETALLVTVAEPLLLLHEVDVAVALSTNVLDASTVIVATDPQWLLSSTVTVYGPDPKLDMVSVVELLLQK